jgi:type I restriction enzyme M protein
VVEDKWMTTIALEIQGEMDRISGSLAARVKELAERYDAPVTTLTSRVGELEAKVNEHLRKMGFTAELSGAF